MKFRNKKIAESALVLKSIFSGLFPVITVIAYSNKLSPFTTLAWSSLVATIFFASLITYRREWGQNISKRKALGDIAMAILFITIGYYALYFLALKFTSPQNVSLLSLTEIAFSFLIIGVITKKEPISRQHIFGAGLMLLAAGIILFRKGLVFNIGDLFILLAVVIAPIGNIFAKRALYQVSLLYLMFLRSIISGIIFFVVAYLSKEIVTMDILLQNGPYLLFSGLVYFGLMKIVTMFGYKKTSVTHTVSFQSLKPIFTFVFAWLLLKEMPTTIQVLAIIPSSVGLYLLITAKQKKTQYGIKNSA